MEEISAGSLASPEILSEPLSDTNTQIRNIAFYRQAVVPNVDPTVLEPDPWRLVWYVVCGGVTLAGIWAIVNVPMIWPIKVLVGLLIGFCNGALAFISHEILHGSVIKNQKIQNALSFFAAVPFLISPTFWRFWHNRLHHGKTQQMIKDPDAFPNLRIYKASKFMQFMFPFTPGSGHKRSYFYFFFWFSFHNLVAQTYLRFRNEVFSTLDQKRANIEFFGQVLILALVAAYVGPANWVYVFLAPLAVQNYFVMSYISTNHNLSPLTRENDPLDNSLTVTNHPVFEYFSLNFGYHVEHHIFPTANSRKIKVIHRELLRQFPDTFKVMTKWQAIKALYRTPRIYKNARELVNPETGQTAPTI